MNEDALQRQLRFYAALNRLGEVTLSTDEPASLLDSLAQIAGVTLEVDRVLVFDVRIEQPDPVPLAEWVDVHSPLMPPEGARYLTQRFGEVIRQLWWNRTWLESHGDATHQKVQLQSILWFPFSFDEHGFRLMVFHQRTSRPWLNEELGFISAVGKHMRLALVKLMLLEELKATQQRYETLYDYAPSMFFTVSPERKVLSVNRLATEHLGFTKQELLGSDVLSGVLPEDREGLANQLEECFAHPGQVFRWEARHVKKDGSVISVRDIVRTGIGLSGQPEALLVCDDVTEQKRTEQAMLQTQKLETLGVLVGGISHDFNNLLGIIVGNAELALMRLTPDAPAREPMDLAATAAMRAAELVKQLLTYSSSAPFTRQRVAINEVVRELAGLLVVTVGKRVKVELALDPRALVVVTDPTQLRQVVVNLVHNAADAMDGREGSVLVRTTVATLDEKNRAGLRAGRYACVEVVDSGTGIDPGRLERIFDPFYTTKVSGRGLGLSAVRSIVQRHQGGVLVDSTPGEGSTFTVLLPLAPTKLVELQPSPPAAAAELPRGATVLVVDDDPSLLRVLSDIIREFGLVPLPAGGAVAGRELFLTHPEICCVLMDLTMPAGGGVPLVKEFHQLRPAAPILLISGFAQSETPEALAGELSAFLPKPFTPVELKAAVVRTLAVAH